MNNFAQNNDLEAKCDLDAFFLSSPLMEHPVKKEGEDFKATYISVLEYFVHKYSRGKIVSQKMLEKYSAGLDLLPPETAAPGQGMENILMEKMKLEKFLPLWVLYCFHLVTDAIVVSALNDPNKARLIADEIKELLGTLQKNGEVESYKNLPRSGNIKGLDNLTDYHEKTWKLNIDFQAKPLKTILFVGNVNSGKSTLINALIGQKVCRSANETMTAKLHYVFERPFEDGFVHKYDHDLNLNAAPGQLLENNPANSTEKIQVACCFKAVRPQSTHRWCFIDTPGFNSALHPDHGKLTRRVLGEEQYDRLVYVINAGKLGSDEERISLEYVSANAHKGKTVFILNKLDEYNYPDDSIEGSIKGLQDDLRQLGYDNPVICPLSAYFAFLLETKRHGGILGKKEELIFELYTKQFSAPEYDLSRYARQLTSDIASADGLEVSSNKCGLHSLKNILWGGRAMKEVFIKYNPYKLETEIAVDGKSLKENSGIGEKAADGCRLQEWIEELPQLLKMEYSDTNFKVTFHGTTLDYEDVKDVLDNAVRQEKLSVAFELIHIPAKETGEKEALIDAVFEKIQQGPIEELKSKDVTDSFEKAKSDDFEVCVVATMSAGKSTLINAMLGIKLMPSKQEACTAIITRIKDCPQGDSHFRAEVYGKDGQKIEAHEKLTYQAMERLNSDENVSEIKITGKIPFVSSEDTSLVLIDTPGPNNSRDERHREVQSDLLANSSKPLLLYIMTGEFGTDDDNRLLKNIAESMTVGGKQSKDRFIFVVNKLDGRSEDDGDMEQTFNRIRSYLKDQGISNPNLFPAASLPALNMRLIKNGEKLTPRTRDETETAIKIFNQYDDCHFEKYATLPPGVVKGIEGQLEKARSAWSGENKPEENPDTAIIHTGIPSIEAAISQYVRKYAKTAKIKNIVDTFIHKMGAAQGFEEDKHKAANFVKKVEEELEDTREEQKKYIDTLNSIQKQIDNGKEAQHFESVVDDTISEIEGQSAEEIEAIIQKFQTKITGRIDPLRGLELSKDETEDEVKRLKRFAQNLMPDFEVEINSLINKNLVSTSVALIEGYKQKLASLVSEIKITDNVTIDPLKLMGGSVVTDHVSIQRYINTKQVEDGQEWIENTDKAWYKPWTWLDDDGYHRTKYKTVEYVKGDTLAQEYFQPVQKSLYENGDAAKQYAVKEADRIGKHFKREFKELDGILKKKLAELKDYATDVEKVGRRIQEIEDKLKWLEDITAKMESILEI